MCSWMLLQCVVECEVVLSLSTDFLLENHDAGLVQTDSLCARSLVTVALCSVPVASAPGGDDDKIIGGYECRPHSQPWQVYLTYDNGQRWCGGSLINEWWVVSAAHCYIPPPRLEVHLGEHHLFRDEGSEQHIPAAKVIRHPGYNERTTDNDFMLIKLRQAARLNQYVQPIALATSCVTAGTPCLVSGWGNQLTNDVNYASVLQCLNLPVLSDGQCRSSYGSQITPAAPVEDDKIIGGYECRPHSQPWQASLNAGYHFCGGSLINDQWVISAAHCWLKLPAFRKAEICVSENTGRKEPGCHRIKHCNWTPVTRPSPEQP
nr:PREDICTED: trypsin-2-like [Lepisosteus oculatus]